MKSENSGHFAGAPEIRWNRHVKLGWIQIGEIVEGERRVVAVYALDDFVPIPGPQCPQNKVRAIRSRKEGEPVNSPVLADPVSCLYVIGVCVLGESGSLSLLRGEEALLLFSNAEEPPGCFTVRLRHNTILQLY